ncbi:MAG TPA: aldo/keto reductase [Burkholderiaceae bacterium]|nr:aldo/keto reductase [Burkholderiaceae bacterium]
MGRVYGERIAGWTADEATSHALLDHFVEAGGNFVDTANVYSAWVPGHFGGESETLIGRWVQSRRGGRDRLLIATKVGMDMPEIGQGLKPAQIERGVEDSLRRLRIERIDLLYAHRDDPDTALEDTLAAFDRLVRAGKVRAIAASNYTAERLEQALAISARNGLARYECLQPPYNLLEREPVEGSLAPLCRREGVGIAPYYSLAMGFLSGKYRRREDFQGRPRAMGLVKYDNARGWRVVETLHGVARRYGVPPASIAIAWVLAQPGITSAIASATSTAQLDELMRACNIKLDDQAVAELSGR